jgi:hypothetical protein
MSKLPDIKLSKEDQLEELEFLRDRWKEKQLKLTSLQVAQIYIQINKLKENLK